MLCSNTEGSYECNCNDGYELHQDGRICVGKLSSFTLSCDGMHDDTNFL